MVQDHQEEEEQGQDTGIEEEVQEEATGIQLDQEEEE